MVEKEFSKTGNSNQIKLVDSLKYRGAVKSQLVESVFRSINRADFISYCPYADSPQGIGFQATISAPHMHAYALEQLCTKLQKAKSSLDVGSGSGFLTLAFAKMMEANKGVSQGIEHIKDLVKLSISNISKNHKPYLDEQKVVICEGDGRLGLSKQAPYDCIHVGAASNEIPKPLLDQLAPGGRMLIPLSRGIKGGQDFTVIDKDEQGKLTKCKVLGVSYVPLTSKEKQCPSKFYH